MNSTTKTYPKRICPVCLGTFRPRNNKHHYCDECRKNRKYDIHLYRNGLLRPICKDNMDALHAMNAEIEAYNKKHGTNYTYGKYIHDKTYGRLVK